MGSLILGIETSCDETSAAVVRDGREVLSNLIHSQVDLHERYGGVVPELASRRHITAIVPVIDLALEQAGVTRDDLDAIAVTEGPGLAGSLLVGVNLAKTLAFTWGLPLVPVNHLEGHIYANWLSLPGEEPVPPPAFPLVCLIASGGHTELVLMRGHGDYVLLGRTIDDAAGEAFDKGARILGLGYPGGPAIQRAAEQGRAGRFTFPRAWLGDSYDFSFSGLKTALLREVEQYRRPRRRTRRPQENQPFLTHQPPEYSPNMPVNDLAADYQEAIVDVLAEKTIRAARATGAATVLLAGGVAANKLLRRRLTGALGIPVRYPPPVLCTDNAAMIAGAAYYLRQRGVQAGPELDVHPQLPLVTRTALAEAGR
ncbi:MAG: tRNA (adenosine(37)-N6)-threonylcarbamoyltransferase complex transferase subunit TsaD [Sphaerobacter sp.]|nr:tRNA (adenosine(37)-N6)-threonylcarbamoyltransferase complex transferase subunit TsaD [Sphaerobacter sp.]